MGVTKNTHHGIKAIYNSLEKSGEFRSLLNKVCSGDRSISVSGLTGPSKHYLVSALTRMIKNPVLFISPTRESALRAQRDLTYFLGVSPGTMLRRNLDTRTSLFASDTEYYTERMGLLHSLTEGNLVIAESECLFEKFMPRDIYNESLINISRGDSILRDEFLVKLRSLGYRATDFVQQSGEIATRGSIVDIFSPGRDNPLRIEFLGDEIGSIREFSSEDQKSKEKIEKALILPASEIIMTPEVVGRAVKYLRIKAGANEVTARNKLSVLEEIERGDRFLNIEWLLPAFYKKLSTLWDYLAENTVVVYDEPLEISSAAGAFEASLSDMGALLRKHLKIWPDTTELYLSKKEVEEHMSDYSRIGLSELDVGGGKQSAARFQTEPVSLKTAKETESPLDALVEEYEECKNEGITLYLAFNTENESDKMRALLKERGIQDLEIYTGGLSGSFKFYEAKLEILSEKDIFGEKRRRASYTKSKDVPSAFITSFSDLKPGDYIVHADFGIGIFRNLKRLKIGEAEGDFIQCEYSGGDKIYVPIDKLKLVQRYVGDGKAPKVDKLGQESWGKRVRKVRRAVESVARELLMLYARRKAVKGFEFSPGDEMFSEFELEFPYDETPDQEAAIEDVLSDMEKPSPMDRLICGDVGFGKTEVALRAAFRAAADGKQVAFLVPTTLLAHQHYKTSLERLSGYPLTVEVLSRFRTIKQEKEILTNLRAGKIDIIIGTHKLLSDKIAFKDLGLVIVDEEHRFGVTQKEKLKKLKEAVDTVSMSATPIPRTLQLSLAKIRDISLINTPPLGRQSIETYVHHSEQKIITDAIERELARGGSVFFIHNRIQDIHRVAERISKLVPQARIEVTHGRMRERLLEEAISRFIGGEADILVTTAIVESGLDIPRANTIIIDDAHTFGLADLYQLRGRVGRSNRKAYAYLLIPGKGAITQDARRRLKAISQLKELGSGYRLALTDLEIRGAGHLFGNEQSGHIADVGLELYLDMLEGAVRRLEGKIDREDVEPDISVSLPAFIPDDYIPSDSERLLFYKRLSTCTSNKELSTLKAELRDRFGKTPKQVSNLIELIELKIYLKKLGVEKAEIGKKKVSIKFLTGSDMYNKFPPEGKMEIYLEDKPYIGDIKNILKYLAKRGKEPKA
jgi:transcription-repair coupling factor (superfamily II helicase)